MLHGCHALLDILNYVTAYYFSNSISAVQKEASSVEKGVQIEYIIKHGRKHSPAFYSFFFFFFPPRGLALLYLLIPHPRGCCYFYFALLHARNSVNDYKNAS